MTTHHLPITDTDTATINRTLMWLNSIHRLSTHLDTPPADTERITGLIRTLNALHQRMCAVTDPNNIHANTWNYDSDITRSLMRLTGSRVTNEDLALGTPVEIADDGQ